MIKPELAEIIEKAIENRLIDVHTGLPCRVESVDLAAQTVEVVPQLKRPLENEAGEFTLEVLPKLDNVPIAVWRTSTKFISLPIAPGDYGRIQFAESDWGQWRAQGVVTSPGDIGRFTLSSGIFVPDIFPTAQALTDVLTNDLVMGTTAQTQLRFRGATAEFTSGGAVSSTNFVAMANLVENFIALFQTMMSTWVPVPQDGGAALQALYTSTFSSFVNNMKSKNLKAD